MVKMIKNKEWVRLVVALLLLVVGDNLIRIDNSRAKAVNEIESSLSEIQHVHDSIHEMLSDSEIQVLSKVLAGYENKVTPAVYAFEHDTLLFWSSDINEPDDLRDVNSPRSILKQGDGIFYVTSQCNDSVKILLSTPLYRDNPNVCGDNKFLPKAIDGDCKLDFVVENDAVHFHIDYASKMNTACSLALGSLLIYIIILSLKIIYGCIGNSNIKRKYPVYLLSIFLFYLILLFVQRFLFLNTSDLFGVSCLLPGKNYSFSLGELAEFTVIFIGSVVVFPKNINIEVRINQRVRELLGSVVFVLVFLIYTYLTVQLISNVNIHFSFLQVYSTNVFSYIFLIITCILTSSVVILLQNIMNLLINDKQSYVWSLLCFLIVGTIAGFVAEKYVSPNCSLVAGTIGIVVFFVIIWEKKSAMKVKSLIKNIVVISLMTMQLTYMLYLINETKEKEEMSWFASVIGDESDRSFEEEVLKAAELIKNDEFLLKCQDANTFPSDDSILAYLDDRYFYQNQLKGYNKTLTLCDTNTILLVGSPAYYEVNCLELFDAIFRHNKIRTVDENLTQIDDPTTDTYYILELDLSPIDSNHHNVIYIEFYKEYILNNIVAPEILNSQENVIMPNLHNYSFSSYQDGILQYKYGHYNYPNELDNFRHKGEEYVKTRIFKHYVKKMDGEKTTIVTVEKPQFIDIIAPFSYIFIVLMLVYYCNVRMEKEHDAKVIGRSFHEKMQIVIMMTLGFSFLVVGVTSFAFMQNSLNDKDFESQYEKNKSIIKNLEGAFDSELDISDPAFLKNFKDIYFTDINIYDLDGSLINTTQPGLFDGFKSSIINKDAYDAIVSNNRFYYAAQEYIGDTRYNSSYFSLRDKNGDCIAIINIPFFENTNVSKGSISYFIVTYSNIILVLMGLSALIVILMTRKTIKPLAIIQDKMQKINLGEKNEIIEWKSNDEIGELIEIYNKLIKELEISANKLMRSERETAWREMARQVAHEIKNPLTPMKLNVQFLQMAWDEGNPDIDRKLKETTNSILEQIEILSSIATAFSDYAKLPKNNIEKLNVKELIINTINLYDNCPNIKFELIEENHSDYMIDSDKNNLGIVFGNIVKNAVQAIGGKENGNVVFKISDLSTKYRIEIADNGCGIRDEEKKKIFMPNFTTKSSGMGVGLSIVYDILETLNGSISFESEVGVGTTFVIELGK